MSEEKRVAYDGCGCALIILAVGMTLGWAVFVEGVVRILEALK